MSSSPVFTAITGAIEKYEQKNMDEGEHENTNIVVWCHDYFWDPFAWDC